MADDYDGLTLNEALRLCTVRHESLSQHELKFIAKLASANDVKPEQRARLTAIIQRLRQGDILAAIEVAKRATG